MCKEVFLGFEMYVSGRVSIHRVVKIHKLHLLLNILLSACHASSSAQLKHKFIEVLSLSIV